MGLFDPLHRERRESFWALRDVSLSVPPGQALGIIGANGSGKTTLLSLVAGTLQPTRGEVAVFGRVSPMLGIGIGFNQELNGQENIFLSGSLLGMSRRDVERLYPVIVEFAELGEFLDVPVKNYSSGMLARLGFAVAAHLDPDILLIDETLGVGDEAFQRKCLDRMMQFRSQAKTILFVSHDLPAVRALCDRVCLLTHGRVVTAGAPDEVIERYRGLVGTFLPEAAAIPGREAPRPSGVGR